MGSQGASFNHKNSPLIEGQVTLSNWSKSSQIRGLQVSSSNWRESSPFP